MPSINLSIEECKLEKIKVLLTAEAVNEKIKPLEELCDIRYDGWNQKLRPFSDDQLIERMDGVSVLLTSYDKVTRKVFEQCPDLKLIICTRSTPANIDMAAAKEFGVTVCNTPNRNADVTAEFAVAMIMALARNLVAANRAIMDGSIVLDEQPALTERKADVTWTAVNGISPYKVFQGAQIFGKTMGIVGYGGIGRKVAKIMRGFGCHVLVYDPYVASVSDEDTRLVDLDTLLAESDFISCHTKVSPSTEGMFNYEAFCKMKPTTYFINNSRGAMVVEDDLLRALREGKIAGAALDVFSDEPLYKAHPFLTYEGSNLILTPHISGASPDAIVNGTQMMVEEVTRFLNNSPLQYRLC